jgi:hypothetical protein
MIARAKLCVAPPPQVACADQLAGGRQENRRGDRDDGEPVRKEPLAPREPELAGPADEHEEGDRQGTGEGSRGDTREQDERGHAAETVEPGRSAGHGSNGRRAGGDVNDVAGKLSEHDHRRYASLEIRAG